MTRSEIEEALLNCVCANPEWIYLHRDIAPNLFNNEQEAVDIFALAFDRKEPLIEYGDRAIANMIRTDAMFVGHVDKLIEMKQKDDARKMLATMLKDWDNYTVPDVIANVAQITSDKTDKFYTSDEAMAMSMELTAEAKPLADVEWTIPKMNDLTRGLHPNSLIVIGGRPGTYKTALAIQIAKDAAKRGHPVAMWELEMTEPEVGGRIMANEGEFDGLLYISGDKHVREIAKKTEDSLKGMPFHINTKRKSITQICHEIVVMHKTHGIKLAIVDYLQLIPTAVPTADRHVEIGEFCNRLKDVAKLCNIPVIVLSQLSRDVDKRTTPPVMSDLSSSGGIEAAADIILFTWMKRFKKNPDDKEFTKIERLILAKQRNGPAGKQTNIMTFGPQFRMEQDVGFYARREKDDTQRENE